MSTAELTIPRLSQPLKLWEKLELVVGDGDLAGVYTTRVEDFINSGIVVSRPQLIKGKTLLREGQPVSVFITRQDAAYRFHCTIKAWKGDGEKRFLLSPPRRVDRVQRRASVRIELMTRIRYARIVPVMAWEDYDDRCEWHESVSVDISAGGVFMKGDPEIAVDQRLLMQIALFQELELPRTIAAIVRRTATRQDQLMAGVEFLGSDVLRQAFRTDELRRLPQTVREYNLRAKDKMTNYVFHRQIELRQKGLL